MAAKGRVLKRRSIVSSHVGAGALFFTKQTQIFSIFMGFARDLKPCRPRLVAFLGALMLGGLNFRRSV